MDWYTRMDWNTRMGGEKYLIDSHWILSLFEWRRWTLRGEGENTTLSLVFCTLITGVRIEGLVAFLPHFRCHFFIAWKANNEKKRIWNIKYKI